MPIITIDLRMIDASGIGTYLQNLVPRIIELNKEAKFYLLGDPNKIANYLANIISNYFLIQINSPIYSPLEQLEIIRKIPKNTDVFWCPHFNIPILYKGKMVVTIHDLFHLSPVNVSGKFHHQLYAKFLISSASRRSTSLICVSNFTASELITKTNAQKDKISVIYPGIDVTAWHSTQEVSPEPNQYLLFVGNVKPHKNLKTLLEAFELIIHRIPYNLIIVGKKEGFITNDLISEITAKKFNGRIKFTGFINQEKLKQYYKFAEALVLPSLYEGFGFPPLEAMASGCPVIASHLAAIPEVCGNAALYCDSYNKLDIAEKILMYYQNSHLRNDLINKGYSNVKRFSWEQCALETQKVLINTYKPEL